MDDIAVKCPQCGAEFLAPVSLAGQRATCACGQLVDVPAPPDPDAKWYYSEHGQPHGTFTLDEMREMVRGGQLRSDHLVFTQGLGNWKRVSEVAELRAEAEQTEPKWYVSVGGRSYGPYTDARMREMVEGGKVAPKAPVWHKTLGEWTPLEKVPELAALVKPGSQQAQPTSQGPEADVEEMWFYMRGPDRVGPLTLDQIVGAAREGRLGPKDRVWSNRSRQWRDAADVPDLASAMAESAGRVNAELWYYRSGEKVEGPVSFQELTRLIEQKRVWVGDTVFSKELGQWREIRKVPQLEAPIAAAEAGLGAADTDESKWFFRMKGAERGPVTERFIAGLVAKAQLRGGDMVYGPGSIAWRPVRDVPQLAKYLDMTATASEQPQAEAVEEPPTTETEVAVERAGHGRRWRIVALVGVAVLIIVLTLILFVRGGQ